MAGGVSYILCHFKSGNYFVGLAICYCCFLGIVWLRESMRACWRPFMVNLYVTFGPEAKQV